MELVGRFKPAETIFERELRLMRQADDAERNRAFMGHREEQAELVAYEAIGMSPAAAAVLTEPHEREWNFSAAMGEAHHEEPPR